MLLNFLFSKIFLVNALLLLLMIGVTLVKLKKEDYSYNPFKIIGYLTVLVFLISIYIEYYFNNNVSFSQVYYFSEGLIFDKFSYILTLIVYALGAIISWLSLEYFNKDLTYSNFEYFMLIILSISGIILILNSSNLLVVYLGLELQSLPFYVLAAFRRFNRESTEAGLKYFVLGGLSSALYLLGASIIYGLTGTVDLATIRLIFENLLDTNPDLFNGVLVGLTFLLSAIFFKLSVFPFHTWTPDVYAGSILPVVLLFATASKIGVFCFLSRLIGLVLSAASSYFSVLFVVAGITSILVGTLGAMYQISIKRLLAYSTIGHMGYVMLALSSMDSTGIVIASMYVLFYVIINLTIFTVLIILQNQTQTKIYLETVYDLRLIRFSNKWLTLLLSLLFLSLAGIPPLLGFFSKYFVIFNLIDNNLYFTAFVTVLISAAAAYYYLRLIRFILFIPAEGVDLKQVAVSSSVSSYLLSILLAVNVLLVLFVDDIINYLGLIIV